MTLVIDASVALKWVLAEDGSSAADLLLDQELIAPELWMIEAANALWRRVSRGALTAPEAEERLLELSNAPVASIPITDDIFAAAGLSSSMDHPVYDCLYIALAQRENTTLITADTRLFNKAQRYQNLAPVVRLLGS